MDAARAVDVADSLRGIGFRVTQPRLEVYATLQAMGGHRSVDEIVAELRCKRIRIPRMSVYNAVGALHDAGLLMRADAGPGRTLYETRTTWHHHFVCRTCSGVFDVPCLKGRKPCLKLPSRVGRADEAQIIFRGVCRSCR